MFLYKSLGFSTLELLIAGFILTIAVSGAILVVFTIQDISLDNSQMITALSLLSSEMSLVSTSNPRSIFQDSTEVKGDFTVNRKYTPLSRFATQIEVKISWQRNNLQKNVDALTILSDYKNSFGTDTCDLFLQNQQTILSSFIFPLGQNITDLDVLGDFLFVSVNDASLASPDLFAFKIKEDNTLEIIASLNTGPGIDAITIAGNYLYAANTSINSQLQIINITNPAVLVVAKNYKLPNVSGTNAVAHSIFYQPEKIYLGLVKTTGPEFNIIDVRNKLSPQLLGSYEVDTEINSILVDRNIAYLTTPNQEQLRLLNVEDPNILTGLGSFSDSGFEAQDGRSVDVLINKIFFGRTVGGFNNPSNHELYNILRSSDNSLSKISSKDLAASSRGMMYRSGYLFVGTNDPNKEWQVWTVDENGQFSLNQSIDLSSSVLALDCQDQQFFVALENSTIVILGYGN